MKVYKNQQTREEYFDIQKRRSMEKYKYCKVSVHDVLKYKKIIDKISRDLDTELFSGPIVCMGTRNGREVDIFRTVFRGNPLTTFLIKSLETRTHSFVSRLPIIEGLGRSSVSRIDNKSVIGVEINPEASRSDIGILSFDELPQEWEEKFLIVYSNSFDQSQDPYRTSMEWKRVIKKGGIMILCYTEKGAPSYHDPVGDLTFKDIVETFGGKMIYYCEHGSRNNYSEVILQF